MDLASPRRRSQRLLQHRPQHDAADGLSPGKHLQQALTAAVEDVLRVAGTAELYAGAHEASPAALARARREHRRLEPTRQPLCSTRRRLLHHSQVPPHLAFNSFVHGGYRCGLCTASCCASAFPPHWHNESLNIWTHAFAAGLGVHGALTPLAPGLDCGQHTALRLCAAAPMVVSFSLSVVYHTFLAHKACSTHARGPERYHNLLCADVAGVVAVLSVPQFAILHYGFWTHPALRAWLFLVSAMGALLATRATRSKDQTQRAVPLACLVLARWTCLALRLAGHGNACPQAVGIYVLMELILAVGGACNALFIPERWLPGRLDYGVNSHNIMHALTTAGAYLLLTALRADATCMLAVGGQPGLSLRRWW
jgi:predicted membrane channel-forming protein YqfA (hemolysin III family)